MAVPTNRQAEIPMKFLVKGQRLQPVDFAITVEATDEGEARSFVMDEIVNEMQFYDSPDDIVIEIVAPSP
jgi:hypothetical protein